MHNLMPISDYRAAKERIADGDPLDLSNILDRLDVIENDIKEIKNVVYSSGHENGKNINLIRAERDGLVVAVKRLEQLSGLYKSIFEDDYHIKRSAEDDHAGST